ncbi:sensor histidine kinase [Paenibacillus sp. MBLB4367]|uniref:cache domain-containing sensor histidine kinase n=1 Tax=Paenibacillus sp. MBLB4367 TaxID=3384767 RepID=UPI0039083F6D
MEWLAKLSIRGLQFRMLVYLLVIGLVPLLLSTFVFYKQSNSYALGEWSGSTKRTHEQLAMQIERELSAMDIVAKSVNADSYVQQALKNSSGQSGSDFIRSFRNLRETQLGSSRYLEDICLFASRDGFVSSCRSTVSLPTDTKQMPKNRTDKWYRIIPPENGKAESKQQLAALVAPLFSLDSSAVEGQIVVTANLSLLLAEIRSANNAIDHLSLMDEKGNVVTYGRNAYTLDNTFLEHLIPGQPAEWDGMMFSKLTIGVGGNEWTSLIGTHSDALSSASAMIRNTLFILLAILLLLSVIGSIVVSGLVTKPLTHLRTLMKRAEVGDWKAYWTPRGTREIVEVGESYNQMLSRLDELFRQVKREEALKKEAEIEALQYQLNPHFLYNTLNTIKWVAKIHKTPQISEAVSALVRLLQASLGKKGDFLPLREEATLIRDYMDIQAFRYGERVKLETDIEPAASVCLVPRMILQPLVENAIIHGIEPGGREGVVSVKAWLERDLLLCEVADNGVGMPENQQVFTEEETLRSRTVKEKMSGIGISHIRQKIKLYYGPDYKMHVFSKPNEGTTIRLSLPIHREEE